MVRDIDMEKLTRSQLNDHKHIEALEGRSNDGQEITGHNRVGVIVYEG